MSYKDTRFQLDKDNDLLFFKVAGLTSEEQEEYFRMKDEFQGRKDPGKGVLYNITVAGPQILKLFKLREYAEAHPLTTEQLEAYEKGDAPPWGNNPNCHAWLDEFTKVVFSLELQGEKRVRHLSVSINKQFYLPNPEDVLKISFSLGFEREKGIQPGRDEIEPGFTIVHLLQKI